MTRGPRIRPGAAALALGALVAGASCNVAPRSEPEVDAGDAGNAGDGAAQLKAFDDFVDTLAHAMCAWEFRCCTLYEIDAIGGSSYQNESDCLWYTSTSLDAWFSDARFAMGEDRMSIDAQRAAACVRTFATGGCSPSSLSTQDPWTLFQQCLDPFVGKVPIGERCFLRDECVPEGRCLMGLSTMDSVIGTTPEGLSPIPTVGFLVPTLGSCVPYADKGARCRTALDCAPGLYCRATDFVCARPATDGEPCQPLHDANGNLVSGVPCDDATAARVCLGNVCGRLPRDGEPCITDGLHPLCDPDPALALSCVGMGFNGVGICKTAGLVGAACGANADGIPPCAANLICAPGNVSSLGICAAPPALGETCTFDGGCAPPAVCDTRQNMCVPSGRLRDGQSCMGNSDCASLACTAELLGAQVGACMAPTLGILCTGPNRSPAF